jgi:hypothetical protein
MLTLENTEGFDQETLDKMNEEVQELIKVTFVEEEYPDAIYNDCLKWAENEVLKKYGGA